MKHLVAASLLLLSSQCFATLTPVVYTNSGPVQGQVNTTFLLKRPYSSFRGIPYGKPPIGDLRFRPPVPVEPWQNTFAATADAVACPQIDELVNEYIGEEDCLHLNVYTPVTALEHCTDRKAVLVWLYGGSYVAGSATSVFYGPDMLIEQDLVVVIFNYRLGALGFLSLSREEAAGNAGMRDQILVLQWVQQNIAKFGGDPSRVTIAGQSSGSALVFFHLQSPLSTGLFARAIAMSGTTLSPWAYHSPKQAMDKAKQLAAFLGSDAKDSDSLLRFYKNAPAKDLVNGSQYMDELPSSLTVAFRPTKDSDTLGNRAFLPDCPIKLFKSGRFNKVPILMGQVKEEALGFTRPGYTGTINDTWTNVDRLLVIDEETFNRFMKGKANYSVFLTDWYYTAPEDLTRKLIKQKDRNLPIYSYMQTYDSPYAIHRQSGSEANGTAHADDLQYIFHLSISREPTDPKDPVNVFRRKVSAMWANFVKWGNPTPTRNNPSNVIWEESGEQGLQLRINTEDKMQLPDVSPEARQLEQYLEEKTPSLTDCA